MRKSTKAYIRVSDNTYTFSQQRNELDRYCKDNDLQLKVYKENDNGRELRRLINDLSMKESVLIVEFSVIGGGIADTIAMCREIRNKGANLICLNPPLDFSSESGKIVSEVFDSLINIDRIKVKENCNKSRSRALFGYKFVDKNKDFEPVPEQQRVIKKIIELYDINPNYSAIARRLNEDGDNETLTANKKNVNPDRPPKFHPETVKRILQDHGCIVVANNKRKTIDERIRSCRTEECDDIPVDDKIKKNISNFGRSRRVK